MGPCGAEAANAYQALETILDLRSHLEASLASSWDLLEPSSAILDPSRKHLTQSWTKVGPSWDHLASILALLEPSWTILDQLGQLDPKNLPKEVRIGSILHPKCMKTYRIRRINKISENIFDKN